MIYGIEQNTKTIIKKFISLDEEIHWCTTNRSLYLLNEPIDKENIIFKDFSNNRTYENNLSRYIIIYGYIIEF